MITDAYYKKHNSIKEFSLKIMHDSTLLVHEMTRPMKILGFMEEWPAMSKWNERYFLSRFGKSEILAKRYLNGTKQIRRFLLEDYFNYLTKTGDEVPFYLTDCQLHLETELENDYFVPDIFSCWYKKIDKKQRKSTLSWIYIAPKFSISPLHQDLWGTSAWNGMISGRKLWIFFPPDQFPYLYDGKVDPFNPDLHNYPLFKKAKPEICIQRRGEIIFTPSGWWHAVMNLDCGISITENFINHTNSTKVLDFFRDISQPSYHSIQQLIQNNS